VLFLLCVWAVTINYLIVVLARQFQKRSGFCWTISHAWETDLCGPIIAGICGWFLLESWLDARRDHTYVPPPPLPAYTNVYENVVAPVEDSGEPLECVIAQDKEEARRWAAYAIWYEARGESPKGRMAVASVLWNRAGGDPGNFMSVLQSTNWLGTPEILDPSQADTTCPIYRESFVLADDMVFGQFRPIGRWTHFYNPVKASPAWRGQLMGKRVIGQHVFGVMP